MVANVEQSYAFKVIPQPGATVLLKEKVMSKWFFQLKKKREQEKQEQIQKDRAS